MVMPEVEVGVAVGLPGTLTRPAGGQREKVSRSRVLLLCQACTHDRFE